MPVVLNKRARDVRTDDAEYQQMFQNLQGNILKPHGRNCAWQVFLRFTGSKAKVRTWIRTKIAPVLFTAADQYGQPRGVDGGLVRLFFLSATGYEHLGFKPNRLRSKAFEKGMKHQKNGPVERALNIHNKDPDPSNWEQGFQDQIDAMVVLANDEDRTPRLQAALDELRQQVNGIAQILCVQEGKVLRRRLSQQTNAEDGEPIEHFGYFDGISQPLFTSEDLDAYYKPRPDGSPGRGGTEGLGWDPSASLDLVLVPDPFADAPDAYGSFLVYRKLAQDYQKFHDRVTACAGTLGINRNLAGAMAVGRFQDGTPVVDESAPSAEYKNDFMFNSDDPQGFQCPRHAHIRKVNPRGTTPSTSFEDERRHRIVRRGIPYGKPHPQIAGGLPDHQPGNPDDDRGLLFMCFQANISQQFEFIQRVWADNPNFPERIVSPSTGDDPLIGQHRNEGQRWPKAWDDPTQGNKAFNFEAAVQLKGGEYFFTPSKPFLTAL